MFIQGKDCVFVFPYILRNSKVNICQKHYKSLYIFRELGCRSVLVVTDGGVSRLGLTRPLLEGAERAGLRVTVYDEVS